MSGDHQIWWAVIAALVCLISSPTGRGPSASSPGATEMAMKPEMRRIAPALERWCREAPECEERTVIVRTAPTVPADTARRALEAAGAVIESGGQGVSTARVTCKTLKALATQPEVLTIDEPRPMFPKFGHR